MNASKTIDRIRTWRPFCVITTCAAIAFAVSSCGEDSSQLADATTTTSSSEAAVAPNLVTEEEIGATKPGSPERALLEWWETFQFGDTLGVIQRTSPDVLSEIGESNLTQLVEVVASTLQGIEVVGASQQGNRANVRALILSFDVASDGSLVQSGTGTPRTFEMEEQDGKWLFDETPFLETLLENTDLNP